MDVRGLMRRTAEQWADYEAVVAGEARLTFGEAWERGIRLANVFLDMGLEPGDRVAVLEDNSLEAVDFFLACTAASLVRVPLYARASAESHAYMVEHTAARLVVTSERYAPEVDGLDKELPAVERVMVRDAGYADLLDRASNRDPNPDISPDDLYLIRHTAGTTGKPKGIGITHERFLASERDWFYGFPPVEIGEACLHAGPISHGSGYFFVPPWAAAGRNVLLESFQTESVLDVMERERVAFTFLVPTMLAALAREESAKGRDWSALKAIAIAGSPSSETTLLRAREVFGDVVYQIYGQSEVFPVTMISPRELYADVPGSQPIRSAGRVFPFAELQILDIETHEPLPVGAEGEIAARTDGQMTSFWEDPEATAKKLHDGWVLTGDVGKLDGRGFLYVLDRVDDMIISGGFNIWPAELENVIASHPAVVEVAVFGIPDGRWGETPAAVCVVSDGGELHEDDVVQLCIDRLGSYKKPSKVVISTDPLPKSPAGKVMRRALRDPFWEGHSRKVAGS